MSSTLFDAYATDYESSLQQGLAVSGESSEYFAESRVDWVRRTMVRLAPTASIQTILDYGCGTGNAIPWLTRVLNADRVIGVDTSAQSLVQARARFGLTNTRFENVSDYEASGDIDLAYCNGVFHHIPIDQRMPAAETIFRSLKPGGWFAYWENNPWNPGTRYVMSRIPFDRDAITLTIRESKRLLVDAGFRIRQVDTRFYFPKSLAHLRWLEPSLSWLPFGAQYMVMAQREC